VWRKHRQVSARMYVTMISTGKKNEKRHTYAIIVPRASCPSSSMKCNSPRSNERCVMLDDESRRSSIR
jgi:hypothetical protein